MSFNHAGRLSAVVLAAVFIAGCGSDKVVVERTTTVVQSAAPRPSDRGSSAARRTPVAPSLSSYSASLYSARAPSAWPVEEDDVQKTGLRESQWRNPSSSTSFLRIDAVGGESESPASKAAQVRAVTSRTPGYREISFAPDTLAGHDAWRWVFEVSGTRRVDYFRNECGTGVAVLGATAPGDFSALEQAFREVAASVSTDCASVGGRPTAPSGSGGGGSSGQGFCSTHPCIANFDSGTGYIVQCNDGMWSHSGGRPGACSYHSGESDRTYP